MKAAIIFLLAMLSAVATPAAAEWTPIGENTGGDQIFIDYTTFKTGARPRAWTMWSYAKIDEFGDFSNKSLIEADCSEEKIRVLAVRFYTDPKGAGAPSTIVDKPREWKYVTPNSAYAAIARILCRGNQ
jgi:hypothetical protein